MYSQDLRERVVAYVHGGGKKREAARLFKVGENTVYLWIRLYKKQGSLAPKKRTSFYQTMDPAKLKEYVAANPDHTISQIAHALKAGRQTVFSWLRRLGITRKKNGSVQGTE